MIIWLPVSHGHISAGGGVSISVVGKNLFLLKLFIFLKGLFDNVNFPQ